MPCTGPARDCACIENTSMAPRRLGPPRQTARLGLIGNPKLPTTNEVRSPAVGGNIPFNAHFIL
jgi:hypothetical protein